MQTSGSRWKQIRIASFRFWMSRSRGSRTALCGTRSTGNHPYWSSLVCHFSSYASHKRPALTTGVRWAKRQKLGGHSTRHGLHWLLTNRECITHGFNNNEVIARYCHVYEWLLTGFGLVIGFVEHLHTQLVTTSNYTSLTGLHTVSSLVVSWERILTTSLPAGEYSTTNSLLQLSNSQAGGHLTPNFCSSLHWMTKCSSQLVPLIIIRHGSQRNHSFSLLQFNRFHENMFVWGAITQ
jgi:hypothetical protein